MVLRPQRQRRATAVAAAAAEEKEAVAASLLAPLAPSPVTGVPSAVFKAPMPTPTAAPHPRPLVGSAGKSTTTNPTKPRSAPATLGGSSSSSSGTAGRIKTSGVGHEDGVGTHPQTLSSSTSSASLASSSTTTTSKKGQTPEFLVKLHRILLNEDKDIIYWDNGQIHVRNPTILGQSVLHKYFRHSKYSSFQRQLNYFGFRKTQGKGKMSACTYTNVQLSGGNIKSLLNVKRKSSTGTGGKGEGEEGGEGGEEGGEELEEGTDSDEEASEGYTPITVSLGQKRGASLSFSASSALSMSSISTGSSMRKRVRSSSSSSSLGVGGVGGRSLEESLAADECLDGEEEEEGEGEEEEGSEGNTSAGAHSGYSSSLGDEEEDEEEDDDEDDYDDEDEDEEDDTHHSFPSSHAVKHRQSHLHLPPHQQQQQYQQHQLQLGRGGPPRLTFTLSGGIRTCHSGPTTTSSSLPSSSSTTITTLPTTTTTTTTTTTSSSSGSSSTGAGAKPLDMSAVPNFFSSYNVLPAPSPRGADDLFPSCLASFDPLGDSASSPWAWVEPPISGSLSSLSLETGCGMTPLGTLDEGNSNHSAFARDEDKGGREGRREREVLASMPSAAAIAAAALCSPRGESAFLLSVEGGGGGGGGGDFWGGKAASASP